jgi:hypothetical protein
MQFNSFSRREENGVILFTNDIPLENVELIKYYSDDRSGFFSKIEFRWSFDNVYWSAWEILTQQAISRIKTYGNYYFFLEIRYVLNSAESGNVEIFTLNYTARTGAVTPRNLIQDIETQDTSAVLIHDVIQKYLVTSIIDASTLNGYSGYYYLNRAHQYGQQPINSIIGLTNIINQMSITLGTKNSSSNGVPNQISYDASYLYVCTSTNLWGRIPLNYDY